MEWISVKYRLPPESEEVLTFDQGSIYVAQIVWFNDKGEAHFMARGEFSVTPTHWMPLPEHPKGG